MNKFIKTLKDSELLDFLEDSLRHNRIVNIRMIPLPSGEIEWSGKSSFCQERKGKIIFPRTRKQLTEVYRIE